MSDTLQGILWALLATALFATVAALAKVAVADYHVLEILFFRQLVVFASALPNLLRNFPDNLRTSQPLAHGLRLIGAFCALSAGIWAVAVLPLATAVTLAFSQVFFVALLARWFLGEPVDRTRLVAVAAGFLGVIIVMRPGVDGLFNPYALIPVGGALGAAIAVSCVRHISQTESSATLLGYQAIFVGAMSGIPMFWLWVSPTLPDLILLLTMAVLATAAQWIGIRALRLAEVSIISNIEYMKLIYSGILGYLLFQEVPDRYTVLGALVIVFASACLFRREIGRKATLPHKRNQHRRPECNEQPAGKARHPAGESFRQAPVHQYDGAAEKEPPGKRADKHA